MKKKLVIFGIKAFAETVYQYFKESGEYEIIGFCSYQKYIDANDLFNLPIYEFEFFLNNFNSQEIEFFVAISEENLNETRQEIYEKFKQHKFIPASFISKKSAISPDAKLGEHLFISDNVTIQPFVEIGNNVIIWQNCSISHHCKIGSNSFISAGTIFGGVCQVGRNCFIGIGCLISPLVKINEYSFVAMGSKILFSLEKYSILSSSQKVVSYKTKEALLKILSFNKRVLNDKS